MGRYVAPFTQGMSLRRHFTLVYVEKFGLPLVGAKELITEHAHASYMYLSIDEKIYGVEITEFVLQVSPSRLYRHLT